MSEAGALDDAYLAVRLLAIDPVGLGGIILRGRGEARDAVLDVLRASMPEGSPERRLPTHIDDERLLGGLDLTATLATGRTVSRAGVLVEADGGLVVVPMAERMADG
ncbi:MAG: magnesium chelatase, partial [Sphingobium sp.]